MPLVDPEKRKIYDAYGEEGLKHGGGSPPPDMNGFPGQQHAHMDGRNFHFHTRDPFDIFRDFFGSDFDIRNGGMGGMGGTGGHPRGRQPKAQDLYAPNSPVSRLGAAKFPDNSAKVSLVHSSVFPCIFDGLLRVWWL